MVKQKYHFLAQSLPPNSRKEIECRGDKGGGKKGMEGWAERERGKKSKKSKKSNGECFSWHIKGFC